MRGIQPLAPKQLGRFAEKATHAAGIGSHGLSSVRTRFRAEDRAQHTLKLGRYFGHDVLNNNLFRLLGLVWAQSNLLLQ